MNLLGMNWFESLRVEVTSIIQIFAMITDLGKVCEEFSTIFPGTLGLYNRPSISLQIGPAIWPIRLRVHRVSFALKPKIDEELDCLLEQGVL